MASTKKISAQYSSKLDSMASLVRDFLSSGLDQAIKQRTDKAIEDFLLNNSTEFKVEFLERVGLEKLDSAVLPTPSTDLYNQFLNKLCCFEGECLFLLKDAYKLMRDYQKKTDKGYGLLINREFLCDNDEERYFSLIELTYDSLKGADNTEEFLNHYLQGFNTLIEQDEQFKNKALQIYQYLSTRGSKNIVWVDCGFQYTFNLFCYGAVEHFSKGGIKQDFYNLTAYPWLQDFFKEKYFTDQNEYGLKYELEGIDHYLDSLSDKATGAMVGFAIGDSLGFPAAGIERSDVSKFIEVPIIGFTENHQHPYFFHISAGQYTSNTQMLMVSAYSLIENHGFKVVRYVRDLIAYGNKLLKDRNAERWIGPTAMTAIKKLIDGSDYQEAGSKTTESCSASYRVLPLGIYYRPFFRASADQLKDFAELSGMITHNSEISKAGTAIVALIIADLMVGVLPEQAILGAINSIKSNENNKVLIDKINEAIDWSKNQPPEKEAAEKARGYFGTGSPIYQTLPLAIYYFLHYQNDFGSGILAAANSFREDSPEEKERLSSFSWEEQLVEAKGGNCDGIASLTGAFLGAHVGYSTFPFELRIVEDYDTLADLGKQLC